MISLIGVLTQPVNFSPAEFLQAVLDAERRHVGAVLLDGRQHLAALDQRLHRRDVVEADDLDLAAQARRVERLDDAERHRVVGRHHALDVVILGEEVGHQRVGFLRLPVRGLAVEQLAACLPRPSP